MVWASTEPNSEHRVRVGGVSVAVRPAEACEEVPNGSKYGAHMVAIQGDAYRAF